MSTPHPDTQVQMADDMLRREYKFNIGDVVKIQTSFNDKLEEFTSTIRYPYYFSIDDEQSYITNIGPIPYKDSELKIIKKNPNGEIQTYDYLQKWRDETDSKEYRDKWVPA
jgi:hypothetical protein